MSILVFHCRLTLRIPYCIAGQEVLPVWPRISCCTLSIIGCGHLQVQLCQEVHLQSILSMSGLRRAPRLDCWSLSAVLLFLGYLHHSTEQPLLWWSIGGHPSGKANILSISVGMFSWLTGMAFCVKTSGSSMKLLPSRLPRLWVFTSFSWPIDRSRITVFVPLTDNCSISFSVQKVVALPGSKNE